MKYTITFKKTTLNIESLVYTTKWYKKSMIICRTVTESEIVTDEGSVSTSNSFNTEFSDSFVADEWEEETIVGSANDNLEEDGGE